MLTLGLHGSDAAQLNKGAHGEVAYVDGVNLDNIDACGGMLSSTLGALGLHCPAYLVDHGLNMLLHLCEHRVARSTAYGGKQLAFCRLQRLGERWQ